MNRLPRRTHEEMAHQALLVFRNHRSDSLSLDDRHAVERVLALLDRLIAVTAGSKG